MHYEIYVSDCETTGLDDRVHDIIEISLFRLSSGEQKTWSIKPINTTDISLDALRINGHNLDDLLHKTKVGRDRYMDPNKAIIEIENWILDDGVPSTNRILAGQNIGFDRGFADQLWKKCGSGDSFPFGRRFIDTMVIELFLDYAKGSMAEGYSLNNLVKKYGVVNSKAHTAAADTLATKEVFLKQVEFFKKVLNKSNA